MMIGVIAFALFVDYFLYGVVTPLAAHSPAAITGEEQLAVLYGAYALSVLLITPLCSYLGNRIGLRATILCGAILGLCTAALFMVADNFFLALAARLAQGAASAAVWTAGLALIAEYHVEDRVQMMGYAFTGSTAGSVLGPVLGGVLYRAGGYRLPFAITAVLGLIEVCLLMWFVPAPQAQPRRAGGIRALLTNRSVAMSALAVALAAFAWGVIEPLLPPRLSRLGAAPEAVGLMFTVSAVAFGFCARLVEWACVRLSVRKVILLGTIAMAAAIPVLAVFQQIALIGAALCLINCVFAFMLNPASAELGNEVDRAGISSYSAVYAVYNVVYSVGMMGATALASLAAPALGFSRALLCASAVLILCAPLLIMGDLSRVSSVEPSPAQQRLSNLPEKENTL